MLQSATCALWPFSSRLDIQQFPDSGIFWVVFAFGIFLEKLQRSLDAEFIHELCFPLLVLLIQQTAEDMEDITLYGPSYEIVSVPRFFGTYSNSQDP